MKPPEHIIQFAIEQSTHSPCRSKRGAVIFIGDNAWGHGHNRKPRGFICTGTEACKATCRIDAIHAEQDALLGVAMSTRRGADILHVKSVDGKLVPSGPPSCVECSKLVLESGIRYMWLYHEDGWRRYDAAEFHRLSIENRRQALARSDHCGRVCDNCGSAYLPKRMEKD